MTFNRAGLKSERSRVKVEAFDTWLERACNLQQMLEERPDAEWAWLWRTRLTVLGYLIQRYPADGQVGLECSVKSATRDRRI